MPYSFPRRKIIILYNDDKLDEVSIKIEDHEIIIGDFYQEDVWIFKEKIDNNKGRYFYPKDDSFYFFTSEMVPIFSNLFTEYINKFYP